MSQTCSEYIIDSFHTFFLANNKSSGTIINKLYDLKEIIDSNRKNNTNTISTSDYEYSVGIIIGYDMGSDYTISYDLYESKNFISRKIYYHEYKPNTFNEKIKKIQDISSLEIYNMRNQCVKKIFDILSNFKIKFFSFGARYQGITIDDDDNAGKLLSNFISLNPLVEIKLFSLGNLSVDEKILIGSSINNNIEITEICTHSTNDLLDTIKYNTHIKKINLHFFDGVEVDTKIMAEYILENKYLEIMNLYLYYDSDIDHILDACCISTTLLNIKFSFRLRYYCQCESIPHFSEKIKNILLLNNFLTRMELISCINSVESADHIAQGLLENNTLCELIISNVENIYDKYTDNQTPIMAKIILRSLTKNTSLKSLTMFDDFEGDAEIVQYLEQNFTLLYLNGIDVSDENQYGDLIRKIIHRNNTIHDNKRFQNTKAMY